MRIQTYAAIIAFATATSAFAAQPSGSPSAPSVGAQQSGVSIEHQQSQASAPQSTATKAERRAAKDRAEDVITEELNRQQLAKIAANANPATTQPVPQTATQPSDCGSAKTDCTPPGLN
jgi:hypothetical protein